MKKRTFEMPLSFSRSLSWKQQLHEEEGEEAAAAESSLPPSLFSHPRPGKLPKRKHLIGLKHRAPSLAAGPLSRPISLSLLPYRPRTSKKKGRKKKGKKDSRGKQVKILISYSRARHFQKKRKKRFERSTGLDERRRKKNDPSVGPSSSDRRLVPAAQRVL